MANHLPHHFESRHLPSFGWVREIVFGLNDGIVSTFALLAGITGAVISWEALIIAALVEIVTGALSMALGTFISTKSQIEFYNGNLDGKKHIKKEVKALKDGFENPEIAAVQIGIAFLIGGLVPLWPYFVWVEQSALWVSLMSTCAFLFVVGALKSRFTHKLWWHSGLEMVVIAALAGFISYYLGVFVAGLIG
ncbi:MAG TPA: VIT1/CCC1 transporter family protein [Candidatus Nanoarchaeia archaeon]|nr:VIT1/CCC1 transporter family protein [Candidatus Nanoarchaeia archaeon]